MFYFKKIVTVLIAMLLMFSFNEAFAVSWGHLFSNLLDSTVNGADDAARKAVKPAGRYVAQEAKRDHPDKKDDKSKNKDDDE